MAIEFHPTIEIDLGLPLETLAQLTQAFTDCGDVAWLRSNKPGRIACLLSHPEAIEQVLGRQYRNYRKGVGIDRVNLLLGKGLMVSEGEFWKNQRRMIQPAFHRRVLEQLVGEIRRCTESMMNRWQPGDTINITAETSHVTLDLVLHALFSEDLPILIADNGGVNPFYIVTEESARTLLFAREFRQLGKLVQALVEQRRQQQRLPADLLSMLMQAEDRQGQAMPMRQLIDEVLTMIIAGHETTASALNWVWYLLARNPQVEARLATELGSVLRGRAPEFADLNALPYTQRVIAETMRLYPPGWLLVRHALVDHQIGDLLMPAGTEVLISPYLVHRHPRYWQHPETFDPDHFLPELIEARPRYSYFPFSRGARNCIGEALANMEMLIHVALVAQRYRLVAPPPHVDLEALINLRPEQAIHLTLEERV